MATQRIVGQRIEFRAYAGIDPATGKQDYVRDSAPLDTGKRELDRIAKRVDAKALALAESRRARRKDPGAAPKRKPKADRTVGEAVEAWWKHHGSKLANAPKRRSLIDALIIPYMGQIRVALVAGTPPDDDDERDPDLVYLSEKWEEIRRIGRRVGDEPLAASVIQTAHTSILGPALRRAGHPIPDPGLPASESKPSTTPLPEEMAAFLPFLAGGGRKVKGYTVTRKVRGSDLTVRYEVPDQVPEPNAMDLMLEAFAFLVANGPRPLEAAAITRTQLAGDTLSLDGRGVVESRDADGKELWIVADGQSDKRRPRVITLDGRAQTTMQSWLKFQDEASLMMGKRLGPRALMFSFDPAAKEPISPKVFSGAFARAVDRARAAGVDLPDGFHLYDMRHFGITHMLRLGQGRNVAAVAKRFGTSARMIHARYEHAIHEDDAALADALGSVWAEKPTGDVIELRP